MYKSLLSVPPPVSHFSTQEVDKCDLPDGKNCLAAGDLQSPATEYQDLQSEKTIPMRWP